jgi:hypothetical protein
MTEEGNNGGLGNSGGVSNQNNSGHLSGFQGGQLVTKEQRKGKRENVRSQIALNFILGFFLIIFMAMCVGWYFAFTTEQFKDMLVAISGILGGPLGFIIGFYFKGSTEE